MNAPAQDYEVAIIGGGLAGLTLALQLQQTSPGLSILVLERSHLPAPAAAHKVGESTVEIGAHYLSEILGFKTLLEETQLRKFGLRFYFGSGNHADLSAADELGTSDFLTVPSYQLDRGRLESDLADIARSRGIDLKDGCRATKTSVDKNGGAHGLQYVENLQTHNIKCKWLVDASSRFSVLKRQLNLQQPSNHRINAAWLRLDSNIAVDDWSNDTGWKDRSYGSPRRFSTNHFMGSGYWAWVIPLVDGRTSIGLVADPDIHDFSSYNSFDRLCGWFQTHQPKLAEVVRGSAAELMDFKRLKSLSHDAEQLWSSERWALTGEAGLFADPYYSPGSDFIAMSNTFICDLITRHDESGKLALHAEIYQRMYKSFFSNTMTLYKDEYPGLGDARLIVLKTIWDYSYYWAVLSWLYFREVMTDIHFVRSVEPQLTRAAELNAQIQTVFRARAAERRSSPGKGRYFDQHAIPVMSELNAGLLNPGADIRAELVDNCKRLEGLVPILLGILNKSDGSHQTDCSELGDLRKRFA
jgi:flavin-dependent dehydrogenase